jgi:TPR repeat protein
MFMEGRGTETNTAEGIKWYRRAARRGDDKAQYNLGEAYKEGNSVPRNLRRAKLWLGKAATQGHRKAVKSIAEMKSA